MKKEKLTLYCDQDQLTQIRRLAAGQGLSISAYVCGLITEKLSPEQDPTNARLDLISRQNNAILANLEERVTQLPEQERTKAKQSINRRRDKLNESAQARLPL